MRLFLHGIDKTCEWAGKILGFFAVASTLLIVSEVTLRYAFNAPTLWGTELAIYLAGAMYLTGGGWVLIRNEHVGVDILYEHYRPRMKAIFDMVTSPLLFLFAGALLWAGSRWVWRDIIQGTTSGSGWDPPIFPFRMVIPLAGFFMVIAGIARFIRNARTAYTGEPSEY